MIIHTNVLALKAHNNLKHTGIKSEKAAQRLSSGVKINSAADDAAGLAISTIMHAQIKGLEKANNNINDGISVTQIADGGLTQIHSMLHRANELMVQALNDTNTDDDKDKLQFEINQIVEEIDGLANSVSFNTITLLNRNSKTVQVPVTENITSTRSVPIYETVTEKVSDIKMTKLSATVSTPPVDSNGRFNFYATNARGDRTQLLYGGSSPVTSHPSIRVNGTVYDLWSLPSTYTEPGPTDDPKIWKNEYTINNGGISIIQNISVVDNPLEIGGESYRISYDVINNNATEDVSFDFMYHVDTQLGRNDHAPFVEDGIHIVNNTSYDVASQTDGMIDIYDDLSNPFLNGVIIVKDLSSLGVENEPDILNLGQYNYVRSFDFVSSSTAVGDSGYAVIWKDVNISNSDGSYTMTTYYGVRDPLTSMEDDELYTYNVITGYKTEVVTDTVQTGWREEKEFDRLHIQVGANADQCVYLELCDARKEALGIDTLKTRPTSEANASLDKIDNASSIVSGYRAKFGTYENRLEHTLISNGASVENQSAARSRIHDADMAREMMNLTRANVLQQAGMSMLAQANQSSESVLQLLR